MDGKKEKQVLVCCVREAHSPPRTGMSSPVPFLLPSLIFPLRSNFSVPSVEEKEGGIYKDEDGPLCPCPACSFDLPIQRGRDRQQEESNKPLTNVRFFQEKRSRITGEEQGRGKHENMSLFYLHTLLISPLFPFLPVGEEMRKKINQKIRGRRPDSFSLPSSILSSALLSCSLISLLWLCSCRKQR